MCKIQSDIFPQRSQRSEFKGQVDALSVAEGNQLSLLLGRLCGAGSDGVGPGRQLYVEVLTELKTEDNDSISHNALVRSIKAHITFLKTI